MSGGTDLRNWIKGIRCPAPSPSPAVAQGVWSVVEGWGAGGLPQVTLPRGPSRDSSLPRRPGNGSDLVLGSRGGRCRASIWASPLSRSSCLGRVAISGGSGRSSVGMQAWFQDAQASAHPQAHFVPGALSACRRSRALAVACLLNLLRNDRNS